MLNTILIVVGAEVGFTLIKKFIIQPKQIKMNLKKYSDSDKLRVVELPDELYNQQIDTNIQDNEIYNKTYEKFGKIIEEVIPREDLDNYYRNFKTLKEYNVGSTNILGGLINNKMITTGSYRLTTNEVHLSTIPGTEKYGTITHELLHASSTYYDKENNIIYSGLSQTFINEDRTTEIYGVGINEGYTEYLNCKLFNNGEPFTKRSYYNSNIFIAKALEKVVGTEKMRSLYLKSDMMGLIKELEKNNKREDINKFITLLDYLTYVDIRKKIPELKEAISFVNTFVFYNVLMSYDHEPTIEEWASTYMDYVPYTTDERDVHLTDEQMKRLKSTRISSSRL